MKNQYATLMKEMLELQDSINSLINKEWRQAHNPWYRAIWTECAELMDHIGWKWWKKQEMNRTGFVGDFLFKLGHLT